MRSALSLSALTGRAFAIENIRMQRSRPGLMRQHLTAVQAAGEICGATVHGAELGSTSLSFAPNRTRSGSYRFAISTAGSACLVLQTVLLPLALTYGHTRLCFAGGTHNPLAPPYPYLDEVFLPLLERMGLSIQRTLHRIGFYPGGGGSFEVSFQGVASLQPLHHVSRGSLLSLTAEAQIANLRHDIATRELAVVQRRFDLPDTGLQLRTPPAHGPGNALLLRAQYEHAREMFVGFAEKGVRAEDVAERACDELSRFEQADVPVGEHLADQLLLPLAVAGSGSFRTLPLSDHARSNMQVIERFLPVHFRVSSESDAAVHLSVTSS